MCRVELYEREVAGYLTLSLDGGLPLHTIHVPEGDPPSDASNARFESSGILVDYFLRLWPRFRSIWQDCARTQGQIRQERVSLRREFLQCVLKVMVVQPARVTDAIDLDRLDCSTAPIALGSSFLVRRKGKGGYGEAGLI